MCWIDALSSACQFNSDNCDYVEVNPQSPPEPQDCSRDEHGYLIFQEQREDPSNVYSEPRVPYKPQHAQIPAPQHQPPQPPAADEHVYDQPQVKVPGYARVQKDKKRPPDITVGGDEYVYADVKPRERIPADKPRSRPSSQIYEFTQEQLVMIFEMLQKGNKTKALATTVC